MTVVGLDLSMEMASAVNASQPNKKLIPPPETSLTLLASSLDEGAPTGGDHR
jgi:hypothetical protein